jgi:hypothetical protein
MTNQPPPPPSGESPVVSFPRQISLDWWSVITVLGLAIFVLLGLNVPW